MYQLQTLQWNKWLVYQNELVYWDLRCKKLDRFWSQNFFASFLKWASAAGKRFSFSCIFPTSCYICAEINQEVWNRLGPFAEKGKIFWFVKTQQLIANNAEWVLTWSLLVGNDLWLRERDKPEKEFASRMSLSWSWTYDDVIVVVAVAVVVVVSVSWGLAQKRPSRSGQSGALVFHDA